MAITGQTQIPGAGGQDLGHSSVKHGIQEESATKAHRLGDRLIVGSRVFRYCQASEALTAGRMVTSIPTQFVEDTVTVAHPAGTNKVTITASAAIAAGQLADGLLVIDEGTGAGEQYVIKDNPAIANGATGVITLYDGIQTAWAIADTDISMYTSQYRVQESNTDAIELPVGVPHTSVTDENFFWAQTSGPCGVLIDGAFGNNIAQRSLTLSNGVAGAVEPAVAGNPVVGEALLDAANYEDAKFQQIRLTLE